MIDEAKRTRQTELMIHRVKKLADEDLSMQDKPTISETTRRLAAKKTRNIPISLRYTEEIRLKEIKMQQRKAECEQKKEDEQKECTFKPSINNKYPILNSNRQDFDNPTAALEYKEKRLAKKRLDYLVEESHNLTFKPKINAKSERFIGENYDVGFFERMESYQAVHRENLDRIRENMTSEQTPFVPNLRNKSSRSISVGNRNNNIISKSKSVKKINNKNPKIAILKNIVKQSKIAQSKVEEFGAKKVFGRKLVDESEREEHIYQEQINKFANKQNKNQRNNSQNEKNSGRISANKKGTKNNDVQSEYVPSIRNMLKQSFLN